MKIIGMAPPMGYSACGQTKTPMWLQSRLKETVDMVRKLTLITLIGSAMLLNACNTVRGIGRDVESVGKTVKKVPD
jgi:predicted small secreted protein